MHGRKYKNAAATCSVVFANSAFTADDFASTLSFPRERVLVATPGIGADYTAEGPIAELGGEYLLTVATLEPRKNLGTLVDAFALLADSGLSLVVAGGSGWGEQPELDRPGIVRLGRVTDDELARLYRGAAALVLPSRHEGFGVPVIEAMASGTPVVLSADPALREVAGDAAMYADDGDIAGALERALVDRERLVSAGLERARLFTWESTARSTAEVYRQVLA